MSSSGTSSSLSPRCFSLCRRAKARAPPQTPPPPASCLFLCATRTHINASPTTPTPAAAVAPRRTRSLLLPSLLFSPRLSPRSTVPAAPLVLLLRAAWLWLLYAIPYAVHSLARGSRVEFLGTDRSHPPLTARGARVRVISETYHRPRYSYAYVVSPTPRRRPASILLCFTHSLVLCACVCAYLRLACACVNLRWLADFSLSLFARVNTGWCLLLPSLSPANCLPSRSPSFSFSLPCGV